MRAFSAFGYRAACLALIGLLGGCARSTAKAPTEQHDTAQPRLPVAVVATETVERTVEVPASVEGIAEADLYARVPGYVAEVAVDIGDAVQKGQTLVRLSAPELFDELRRRKAEVELAEADLEKAQVLVEEAKAQVEVSRARVREAKAAVEAARAEVALRKAEFERWRKLTMGEAAIEKRKLDEAKFALDSAQAKAAAAEAAFQTAEAELKAAESTLASRATAARAAEKSLLVARALLKQAETMAGYTELKAPWPAVVVARHVHPGDFALPASTNSAARPVLRLARMDRVRVVAHVPAREAHVLDVGDTVVLYGFGTEPGWKTEARVTRIARALDPETRLMRCEVHLDNTTANGEGFLLTPGTFGYMRIVLDVYDQAMVIPSSAILTDSAGQSYVWRVREDGTVERADVTVSYDDGTRAVVRGDISPGDRVVQAGGGSLEAGQKVLAVVGGGASR